jgi:hypothetical protein
VVLDNVVAESGRGVLRDHPAPSAAPWDVGSVQELIAAIRQFCHGWNQRCQLFTWTKDAGQVLAKLNRQASSTTTC